MSDPPLAFRTLRRESDGKVDPLRFCIATTVSLIALVVTPALALIGFSTAGIVAYSKARKAGLLKSRCILGDTRWVLAYLAAAGVLGMVLATRQFLA